VAGSKVDFLDHEAREIIDHYFEEFSHIREYIENSLEFAAENGYTETLLGRRRYIKDINSPNSTVRKNAERIAINAPIQGLAADVIKMAMIKIDSEFSKSKLKSRMILQVHDELVFEVYKPELQKVISIIRKNMEKPLELEVPLEINIGAGENWLELKEVKKKEKRVEERSSRIKP
jgi:DNA polymerase I